jgi:hypothetical protein
VVKQIARRIPLWKVAPVVVDPLTSPVTDGQPLPAGDPCANCGDVTPGNYCRHCGQARRVVHVSLREMLVDFLDDQLALNSKLPVSAVYLLARPGFLTQEYLRGRIASYIRPLRLYLASSVLFFLVLSIVTSGNDAFEVKSQSRATVGTLSDSLHNLVSDSIAAHTPAARAPAAPPVPRGGPQVRLGRSAGGPHMNLNVPDTTRLPDWAKPLGRRAVQQQARLNAMTPSEALRTFVGGLEQNAPKAIFVLLPVFAFILKLLYARCNRLYVEHFVFTLHVHAFAFLLFTATLLTSQPGVTAALCLWFFVYLFWAMKRVYRQSFMKTAVKYVALGWGYGFAMSIALVLTAAVTALTV